MLISRLGFAVLWIAFAQGCAPTPPQAKIIPTEVTLGGQKVIDNYWWLRDKSDPAVIAYLNAENAYADAVMKPTEPLQEKLFNEMAERLPQEDETVPYRDGQYWYSTRRGLQYPVYLRRKGSPNAKPEVIVDVNQLAEGHRFFDYNEGSVSNDGNLLAFSTDVTGNRQFVLQVKDLRTGQVLKDAISLVDSFEWAADSKILYYVKQDDAKRDYQLYRHVVGKPPKQDELIYEEKDEQFALQIGRTRDRKFMVLMSESTTTAEVQVIPTNGAARPLLIEPRQPDRKYTVDHGGNRFYIRVNDTSRNFRIVTAPDDRPGRANWSELVAARDDVVLDDHDVFGHYLILTERREGLPQLAIAKLPDDDANPSESGKLIPTELGFHEPDYAVALGDNHEFNPEAVRFTYNSLTTPHRVYDLKLSDGTQTLLKQDPVGGGFDAANYREERLFATAGDGTKIPISLVYRLKRSAPDGPATRPAGPQPLLLDGYGSYGNSEEASFSTTRLSLLDRGMMFAIAHVRGGGEFGRAWYDAGRAINKPNTFSDFIAVAEYLEKNGYTSPEKLAIEGGSAGGLLVGAVLNQKPQLFRAAVAQVPWVDVLADMCDPKIPLTTLEYKEWGNPNISAERAVIASYDPYSNVRPQAYPAILVRESLNDSQVQYWDAARWVAKLRAAKKQAGEAGKSELLLKMDMDAGHGGASGLDAGLRDDAFDDAWILTRLGVKDEETR